MRVDYKYLKEIFNVFLDSDKAILTCDDFTLFIEENSQRFAFHMQIIGDKSLVVNAKKGKELGIVVNTIQQGDSDFIFEDRYEFVQTPWRLTSMGYDFAISLSLSPNNIVDKIKNEGISAVIDALKELAKKKLGKLLE